VARSVVRNLWSFSLYPEAAEGGGSLSARRSVVPSERPPNVKRAREEAARRARAKIRRYGAANRLNRLGTLTYRGRGCHDPLRLRTFAVGRFVSRRLIERCWGQGFVHIKLLGGLPVGSGELAEARLAARYLAGYAGRDLGDEGRLAGLHRYEVAQRFQPEKILCYGRSAAEVIERASGVMGSGPERVWLSSSVEGWRGPPACWCAWAG
jgi:hypothetical protein